MSDLLDTETPIEPAGPPPKRPRGRPRKDGLPPGSAGPKKSPGRPPKRDVRARKVATLYEQIGGMIALAGLLDPRLLGLGQAMSEHADDLGAAWAEWAETSDRIAKMLDRASFGGGAAAVLIAHVPLVQAAFSTPADDDEGLGLGGIVDMFANLSGLGGVARAFDQADTPAQ